MNRRDFLNSVRCATAVAVLAHPTAARAQATPVVIGFLQFGSRERSFAVISAFKDGLAAAGLKEGPQLVVEERWANSRIERLQPLAEELAALRPAVIVAGSSQAVAAVAKAAPKTPIVHASGSDPVAAGFAVSLAKPGGMITGITNVVTDVQEKFVELLVSAVPKVRRIGFLIDTTNASRPGLVRLAHRSSAQYAVEPRLAELARPDEIEPAIARLHKEGVQAVAVLSSPLLAAERRLIAKVALTRRLPSIAGNRSFAEEGGLLSYGADSLVSYRRAAYFVDRILKGARPADLPFEQPTTIELVINRRTAVALGLTIPQELLLRANKVIE